MNDLSGSKRFARRTALSFVCSCRVAGRAVTDAEFFDISSRGVKARITHLEVNIGDKVEPFLDGQVATSATARRVGPDWAGIEFDDNLPPHIYERFLFDNAFKPD